MFFSGRKWEMSGCSRVQRHPGEEAAPGSFGAQAEPPCRDLKMATHQRFPPKLWELERCPTEEWVGQRFEAAGSARAALTNYSAKAWNIYVKVIPQLPLIIILSKFTKISKENVTSLWCVVCRLLRDRHELNPSGNTFQMR